MSGNIVLAAIIGGVLLFLLGLHYEISPREKEDEARRHEYEFGVEEMAEEEEHDRAMRRGGTSSQPEGEQHDG